MKQTKTSVPKYRLIMERRLEDKTVATVEHDFDSMLKLETARVRLEMAGFRYIDTIPILPLGNAPLGSPKSGLI